MQSVVVSGVFQTRLALSHALSASIWPAVAPPKAPKPVQLGAVFDVRQGRGDSSATYDHYDLAIARRTSTELA